MLPSYVLALREGLELALILTAASITSDSRQVIVGGLLGLGTAAVLGYLLFSTTVRLNLQQFFRVTSILLIFFAAGLVAYGVHELIEAGWIPAGIEHVWNTNPIIDENSTLGLILKALFGYNGNPALVEVIAFVSYFGNCFLCSLDAIIIFEGFSKGRSPRSNSLNKDGIITLAQYL